MSRIRLKTFICSSCLLLVTTGAFELEAQQASGAAAHVTVTLSWQSETSSEAPGHQRVVFRRGDQLVEVDNWVPSPHRPGSPMVSASERRVMIDGHQATLVTTSMFNGVTERVFALFVNGRSWSGRVVLRNVPDAEVDGLLALVRIRD
jgi:hypothetical protein